MIFHDAFSMTDYRFSHLLSPYSILTLLLGNSVVVACSTSNRLIALPLLHTFLLSGLTYRNHTFSLFLSVPVNIPSHTALVANQYAFIVDTSDTNHSSLDGAQSQRTYGTFSEVISSAGTV